MHGKGNLYDPRLDDAAQFPIAAKNHFGHVQSNPDLISPKLPSFASIPAFDYGSAATLGQFLPECR